MSGKFWRVWAGARNGPQDVLGNATRKRSAVGKGRSGPRLKKSAQRRAHDRLRRRKRIEPAAASVSHVGAPRANPHPRVQFQLEESVCGRWTHVPEFLFPAVRWCGQESGGHRFSAGAHAAHSQAAAFGLGPLAGPPQPSRARLYRPARRQNPGRVSSYAPELNPVEYIWGYWKQHELPNVCPTDYWQLSEAARCTLRRMRRRPRLITAFWKQASLWTE